VPVNVREGVLEIAVGKTLGGPATGIRRAGQGSLPAASEVAGVGPAQRLIPALAAECVQPRKRPPATFRALCGTK